ncbi:MAG: ATP-binding protein [Lewinellaceae bacterium]|nr:ATP-binding protein [Lewinellaceae bacterium]
MINRHIASSILALRGKVPVFTITGPRQSGKTTLIKSLFPDLPYFSMETPDIREQVLQNPRELFRRYGHRMVLDEVQRTPDILSYIQTIVDEDREAFFILSGSHNLLMLENISQSLAGRTAIFYLLPFSASELQPVQSLPDDYENLLFQGFYPRLYDRELTPFQFFPDYIDTYVQRDVRQIKNVGNLNLFTRFLSICAGHIGQVVNYSALANAAGVSHSTAQTWLSILETSFILYQLNPYFRNFNKRVTKSPKLYFYDTGLACSLLRITNVDSLNAYYQKGALFENFIVNEIHKSYFNRGERPPSYFWRDSAGHEVDLVLDLGGRLLPIEIKSGRTHNNDFFKNLAWWSKIADLPIEKSMVIYGGDRDWEMEYGQLVSWKNLGKII